MKQTVLFNHAWSSSYLPVGGAEKVYLLIEAKGNAPSQTNRAPINLSLVLDRSGSMDGEPLTFSKKACQFVTDQMDGGDRLSLVAFDDEVHTVFAPSKVMHKEVMKKKIESIQTGGSTNLSGGLIEGAQYVRKSAQEGIVNRVILLSDGHANQGITKRDKLAAIAAEYRSLGVGITAMGVGDGFDEELMEAIAEHGGGNFYYIDKPDHIPSIFEQELQGLLNVVSQNMKLTLQTTDSTRITGIYGHKFEQYLGEYTVLVGDLYHEEVKSILVELSLDPHTQGMHPVLLLNWEYVDVSEGAAACSYSCEVHAEFTNNLQLLNLPGNVDVQKRVQLTQSARVIEAAMEAFDSGNMQGGQEMLKQQADQMLAMSVQLGAPILAEESEKLYNRLENFTYSSRTRKELHEQKYRQMKRR
ncbi:vWA domain-containing protein [Paenibacillus lignilyticus]|uniref:VWA domain-containing protein n=1 Tax=Paenibacillus lignilyticus TaxID=1172615 RepID=A0ABS5CK79_9BACL|nr:VWA domain-containing protein [Paenibacillus lignilyticus]